MVMLGSVSKVDNEFGWLTTQPDAIGGLETQSPYLVVTDADAMYQRAKAASAKMEIEIKNEDYGGRGFSYRDLEGHLWSVGSGGIAAAVIRRRRFAEPDNGGRIVMRAIAKISAPCVRHRTD